MRTVGFIDLQVDWDGKADTLPLKIFKVNSKGAVFIGDRPEQISGEINEFYLSLPLRLLNFRMLNLPFSDKEKLKKIIPLEIDSLVVPSSGPVVFDAVVLGGSGDSFDVLAVYAETEVLRSILERLSRLKIDPCVVTSLELSAVLKDGYEDIAFRLMNNKELAAEARTSAAISEFESNTINLRTGELSFTKWSDKIEKRLNLASVLLILLALIINADFLMKTAEARKTASSIKSEMRAIYTGLFPQDKKITDELYQMKSHMKEVQEKGEALIGVHPLRQLLDLSRKNVRSAAFNEMTFDDGTITIRGETFSMDDVSKVKSNLAGPFKDITVTDIKTSVAGKIMFTIIAKGRI